MAGRKTAASGRRGARGAEAPRPARRPRRSLWVGLGVALGAALAAVVVERLTRPPENPAGRVSRPGPSSSAPPETPAVPAPPVAVTTDELVDEGRALADRLAATCPDQPDALMLSGQAAYRFGQAGRAVERWQRAIEIRPESAEAWLGLAEYAWEQGNFQEAVDRMRRLEVLKPALAKTKIFILADSLLNLDAAAEVVQLLEDAARTAPLPPWAELMLGQAYLQVRDYQRAVRHYESLLAKQPDLSNAHYGLAQALVRLGRQSEAEPHRQAYVRLKEKYLDGLDLMRKVGRREEKADPAEVRRLVTDFNLVAGQIYWAHEQRAQAEQHWLRAQALEPARPEPRRLLEQLGHLPPSDLNSPKSTSHADAKQLSPPGVPGKELGDNGGE